MEMGRETLCIGPPRASDVLPAHEAASRTVFIQPHGNSFSEKFILLFNARMPGSHPRDLFML